MTERGQQLLSFFTKEAKQDFLALLKLLVEEETPSDVPESFEKLWAVLIDEFKSLGYTAQYLDGHETAGQLVCKPSNFDPAKPQQLIVGHCDTVWPLHTIDDMPFKRSGNKVSGPGVYDMKAGVCIMIFSLRVLKKLGKEPSVQPVFIINSDEEIGSEESEKVIIEEAKKAERTFVLEPALGTEGKIKTERKGIGEFEITIKGNPSHAGLAPEEGVSAILGLSHVVQQLFQLNEPSKGITVNVGTIEGGERANVVAAQSKAVVDVRVPTIEDGKRIENEIYNLQPNIEGIKIEVSGGIRRPPLEKKDANKKWWEITQKLGQELALNLKEGTSGGASDGNITNQYSPTIDGLGAVGEGAHAYHEKIFLEETLQRAALFTLLLLHPSES